MTLSSKSILLVAAVLVIIMAGAAFLLMSNDEEDRSDGDEAERTCTVRYDMNGGTGSIEDANEYPASSTVTLLFEPVPMRTGYAFMGWSPSPDASKALYNRASDTMEIENDTVLYAVWEKGYSVKYDMNGGEGSITDGNLYRYGSNVKIIMSPAPTRDGYVFVGWNTDANSSYAAYDDLSDTVRVYRDLTLFAIWKQALSVIYDLNGGKGDIVDRNEYRPGSTAHPILSPAPTKNGYVFAGWSSDKDASYASYDDPSDNIYLISGSKTLYAVWTPTIGYSYSVKYMDSFSYSIASGYSYDKRPDDGYRYAAVTITVKNNTYPEAYSPSSLDFKVLTGSGIQYEYSSATYTYIKYCSPSHSPSDVSLMRGASFTYEVLYEIPRGSSVIDLTPTSHYGYEYVGINRTP